MATSPLIVAISTGDEERVSALLRAGMQTDINITVNCAGVDVNYEDDARQTPLHWAAARVHP